jgi:hypothetical protein
VLIFEALDHTSLTVVCDCEGGFTHLSHRPLIGPVNPTSLKGLSPNFAFTAF